MAYGVDLTGFIKKKLTDVKTSLENRFKSVFGPIDTDPESGFGQLIGVVSEEAGKLWDMGENVYNAHYPNTAEGVALDNAVGINNITRLAATSSVVQSIIEGTEGTIVPAGNQFRQINTDELFESLVNTEITEDDVLKVVLSISDTGISNDYTVTINGNPNTINSASTDANTLLGLIKTEIESNETGFTLTHDTSAETLTILISDQLTSFSVTVSANISEYELWTPIQLSAINTGSLAVPENSITQIVNSVSGLNSVDNLLTGTKGREDETDDELRLRRKRSLRVTGGASIEAIVARILNEVDGVTACIGVENESSEFDLDGRPPNSIEMIVTGGNEDDIAEKIWQVKAGGIPTFSANVPPIEKEVTDSQGFIKIIRFSRPIVKYVHLQVQIELNEEEAFPANGFESIKESLVAYGEGLSSGKDLIRQRFYSSIFETNGVKGIEYFAFAITEIDESIIPKQTGVANGTLAYRLIDDSLNAFIANGVVSGMCVINVTTGAYAAVKRVLSQSELELEDDIFVSGQTYQVGVFAPINVPIANNEIGNYDVNRITVSLV